jgi:hypothetical protein
MSFDSPTSVAELKRGTGPGGLDPIGRVCVEATAVFIVLTSKTTSSAQSVNSLLKLLNGTKRKAKSGSMQEQKIHIGMQRSCN